MPSLQYEQIYSRFFTKVKAYDLFNDYLYDVTINNVLCNYLHDTIADPVIADEFSTLSLDDSESILTYELEQDVDDTLDKEFVLKILSQGMVLAWIQPKVTNLSTIVQHFSSSDEKWFSQSSHLSELRSLKSDLKSQIYSEIASRGYRHNDYLSGLANSATMRETST